MRIHFVIEGDIETAGYDFARALRRLASDVEAYTNEELEGATFQLHGGEGVEGNVELRADVDDAD